MIHQEITGNKGMWFQEPAGGDELDAGGQVHVGDEGDFETLIWDHIFPFSTLNPTASARGAPSLTSPAGQTHL